EPSGQAASRTERAKQMVRICQSEPSGQGKQRFGFTNPSKQKEAELLLLPDWQIRWFGFIKHQTSSIKHQASNIKHQTSSIKHQA
ncbi:hypothetical protein QUF72_01670, partial [Desulfobacterales bacterium HSG2]|nr:hypothetical protein [Desulfobacterales bacterium HSG2]